MKPPLFVAHRGAPEPGRRPDSLGAIERAAASGRFAYIELDVRRTRTNDDGERVPIIARSASIDSLYDGQRISKRERSHPGLALSGLTYEMLRADSLEVTTLRDALRALNGHPVILEILDEEALIETLDLVREFISQTSSKWREEHFVIGSFSATVLARTKELNPKLKVIMFLGPRNLLKLASHLKKPRPEMAFVYKWQAVVLAPLLRAFKIKEVYCYPVNSRLGAQFFRLFGVHGVATDLVTLPDEF